MADKIIPLSKQYEAHGEVFKSVTVREPRFEDLLALGEPYEVQKAAGNNVVIENTATVAAYVRRCVVTPGIDQLGTLGLADARLVREAVIDFFYAIRASGRQLDEIIGVQADDLMFYFGWQPDVVLPLTFSEIAMLHSRGIAFLKRRPKS